MFVSLPMAGSKPLCRLDKNISVFIPHSYFVPRSRTKLLSPSTNVGGTWLVLHFPPSIVTLISRVSLTRFRAFVLGELAVEIISILCYSFFSMLRQIIYATCEGNHSLRLVLKSFLIIFYVRPSPHFSMFALNFFINFEKKFLFRKFVRIFSLL